MKTTNKNENKPDTKATPTTETTKVNNNPVISTQPELKKPMVDVKKSELPEKASITTGKEPLIPVKESGITDQIIPVIAKPELTSTKTAEVINKPEVPENAPINNDKELVVPIKESDEPEQLIPVVTEPEQAKTESTNPEKSKNPTKAEKAKVIYDEMVKDPKNDRSAIIAKIKKDLVLTKSGALSYFYKFQKESGNVTEKQPSKMDKAKEVYERMTLDGQSRKEIIAAFVKEVGLTDAGASTYYQNLKKLAAKPAKS
jgi:hypothetical protein